jgi:hypothetical protein
MKVTAAKEEPLLRRPFKREYENKLSAFNSYVNEMFVLYSL